MFKRALGFLIIIGVGFYIIDAVQEIPENRLRRELYDLFESGKFEELRRRSKEIAINGDFSITVRYLEGMALVKESRFLEAIPVLESLTSESLPKWQLGFVRTSLAEAYYGIGKKDAAKQELEIAMKYEDAPQVAAEARQLFRKMKFPDPQKSPKVDETFGFPSTPVNDELWSFYQTDNENMLHQRFKELEDKPEHREFINHLKGRILVQVWKNIEALSLLEPLAPLSSQTTPVPVQTDWIVGYSRVFLARAYFCVGRKSDAQRQLEAAMGLECLPNVVTEAKKLYVRMGFSPEFQHWTVEESPDLRVHFSPDISRSLKSGFLDERQRAFSAIKEAFLASLPRKIDLYVWNSPSEATSMGISQLSFARPDLCAVYLRSGASIGHEMTHVICRYGNSISSLHPFLMEGAAVCFDYTGEDKIERAAHHMRSSGMQKPLPAEQVWKNFREIPDLISYPYSGAFIQRLIKKWGIERFREFFQKSDWDSALDIYGPEFLPFLAEFETDLQKAMEITR